MQPTILTVLRSGGDFTPAHVARLRRQCAQHAAGTTFRCLTDRPADVPGGVDLGAAWPGWWAKMNLFAHPGPVLYMDLDTTVTGDLTHLLTAATAERFVALRNPLPTPSAFGTGLMAWQGDMARVLRRFQEDPARHMRRCTTPRLWGDQGFVAETETPSAYWQDLFPGQILSWKVDCIAGVPPGAKIVYFHGSPRPWEVNI